MMKNQEATIVRVRTVVAFGETEAIMTGKGTWRISGASGGVLVLYPGGS